MAAFEKLKTFEFGQNVRVILLLLDVEQKECQNGQQYCKLLLSDGKEKNTANIWDTKRDSVLPLVNGLVQCVIKNEEYRGERTFVVLEINKAPENPEKYKLQDFIISAPIESEKMYDILLDVSLKCNGADSILHKVTENIFKKYKEPLLSWAGAKTIHHAYQGGLLYHMYRMTRIGCSLLSVYALQKDIFITGILLHDIGKLRELDTTSLGDAGYTIDGNLFGHTLLGLEMFEEAVTEVKKEYDSFSDEDTEKLRMVKHMIASHLGEKKYGTVISPAIPEAVILHYIDMIDSRMDIYEKHMPEPGAMSDKIWSLGNKIYAPSYTQKEN